MNIKIDQMYRGFIRPNICDVVAIKIDNEIIKYLTPDETAAQFANVNTILSPTISYYKPLITKHLNEKVIFMFKCSCKRLNICEICKENALIFLNFLNKDDNNNNNSESRNDILERLQQYMNN